MTSGYEAKNEAVIANSIDYGTYLALQEGLSGLGEVAKVQSGSGTAFVLENVGATQLRGWRVTTPSLETRRGRSPETVWLYAINLLTSTSRDYLRVEPLEPKTRTPSKEVRSIGTLSTNFQSLLHDRLSSLVSATYKTFEVPRKTQTQLPPEVASFVADKGLQDAFDLALDLVRRFIPGVAEVSQQLKTDYELGEQWVAITVVVDNDVKALSAAKRLVLNEWIEKTNVEEGELVRINYKFAS
jgi:hypothetical protein